MKTKPDLFKAKTAFRYKPRFAVVIECGSEREQAALYARLQKKKGIKLRLVRV